jgi:glycosyltransferase involved in cell wall biosynthesis
MLIAVSNQGPRPRRLLVVMPAWNEEAAIKDTIDEVRVALPDDDLLVVDDGSTDRTAEVARAAGAAVVTLPYNLGVGGAMRTGYRYALGRDYDIVVQVDADGQHDPAEVPTLVDGLSEADIVIGARFAEAGTYRVRGPRRWAMRLLAAALSRIAGTKLTDTTSGFRAANRRSLALFASHYPAEYLGDTVESLVIAARAGLRIRQVPVHMRPRRAGVPSQGAIKAALYLVRAGLALVLALLRRRPA